MLKLDRPLFFSRYARPAVNRTFQPLRKKHQILNRQEEALMLFE